MCLLQGDLFKMTPCKASKLRESGLGRPRHQGSEAVAGFEGVILEGIRAKGRPRMALGGLRNVGA